eukprot:TRINITY_DN1363_c0_g1_i1.p1 TRINITY_DN1363_c0_g1~~TRINITY_DN1363_c0_g1_i1.p1  ORF type:complete len:235 (+),score=84.52 TRINITY_DN1363_c0_g1_i1:52-705(+)
MGNIFGRKRVDTGAPQITKHDKAILDLKVQRDKLHQYQKKVEIVIEKELQAARDLSAQGKKRQALLALKKKKYQESLLDKTEGMLINLQQMVEQIEFSLIEQKVALGLQQGNETMKEIHEQLSLDDVAKIMDDTHAAIEYQQELEQMLGTHLTAEDEEEIQKQLLELQRQVSDVAIDQLPEPVTTPLPQPVDTTGQPQPVRQKDTTQQPVQREALLA